MTVHREPLVFKGPAPTSVFTELSGPGNHLAWTVDDGASPECIKLYTEFAARTGVRLTFFVNGCYPGWKQNQPILQPLVDTGQVQIANHTFNHADLTKLSAAGVQDELTKNDDFIHSTFGVRSGPYFRPPYGYRNAKTDEAAAAVGFTAPVMWYGTLGDSGEITDDTLMSLADQWIQPQRILIGHANFLTVTRHFDDLVAIVKSRGLTTVTFDDLYTRPVPMR